MPIEGDFFILAITLAACFVLLSVCVGIRILVPKFRKFKHRLKDDIAKLLGL